MLPLSKKLRLQLMRLEKYCNGSEASNEQYFEWSKGFSYRGALLSKTLPIEVKQGLSLLVFNQRLLLDKRP